MRFTDNEIELATRLRGAGLDWEPAPGHYVFDIDGAVRAPSPFQAGVYLIHSTNTFETLVGGADGLRDSFVWLPTWEDARSWLDGRGVAPRQVVAAWEKALAAGSTDREALYGLMLELLSTESEG